jgi:hypothetical protein
MKLTLPRKRTLLAWHRWVGFASALFLVILSLTGLLLNHTEFFKLDAVQVRNDFILSRYGMEPATSVRAYRFNRMRTWPIWGGNCSTTAKRSARPLNRKA